ncbi:MAG: metal ABC transporter permease [Nitrospinales bacterium]
METFFSLMAAPTVACMILAVIYTYFGVHVLKREIIFIDLSLAQLAALGTTVAFVLEMKPDSWGASTLSLGFILLGSAFFTYTRSLIWRVPQEAVIGITYVVCSSSAILLVNQTPHGAEHLKDLLNGSILWMNWERVSHLAVVVFIVSFIHWKFRNRFFNISKSYQQENATSNSFILWDFLFYITLGLVIITSVQTVGMFLVFTYLIIPAVCGTFFFHSMRMQFYLGSIIGIIGSFIGLIISYYGDLPTGATLVCSFGIIFLAALLLHHFFDFHKKTES